MVGLASLTLAPQVELHSSSPSAAEGACLLPSVKHGSAAA